MITIEYNKMTIGPGIHAGTTAEAPPWLLPELIPEANQITTNPFLDMSFGAGGAYQIWFNPANGYGIQGGTIRASMDDIRVGWEAYDAATDTQYGVVTEVNGQTGFADTANRYITLSVSGFSTGLNWYFKSAVAGGGSPGASFTLSPSDFTSANPTGYAANWTSPSFTIASFPNIYVSDQYLAITMTSDGFGGFAEMNTAKGNEIIAFFNAHASVGTSTYSVSQYVFDATWADNSTSKVVMSLAHDTVIDVWYLYMSPIPDTDTNWQSSQDITTTPVAIGTFTFPATFAIRTPPIIETGQWY